MPPQEPRRKGNVLSQSQPSVSPHNRILLPKGRIPKMRCAALATSPFRTARIRTSSVQRPKAYAARRPKRYRVHDFISVPDAVPPTMAQAVRRVSKGDNQRQEDALPVMFFHLS
jgi:hypothetical protein